MAPTVPPPPLTVAEGSRVRLRHVTPNDYEFIYAIETTGNRTARYRLGGTTPGPENFAQSIWKNVLTVFLVERLEGSVPLGTVIAYGEDFRNGHAKIAAVFSPTLASGGAFLEGAELFINYLFATFPLRKLYGDVVALNLDSFISALGRVIVEEGRLRQHVFAEGTYHDLVIIAIYRDDWIASHDQAGSWAQNRLPRGLFDAVNTAEQQLQQAHRAV
jgi:RimJ/RimL family protein N-acetyltransferase